MNPDENCLRLCAVAVYTTSSLAPVKPRSRSGRAAGCASREQGASNQYSLRAMIQASGRAAMTLPFGRLSLRSKRRKVFTEKKTEIQKSESLCSLTILHPWHTPFVAPYLIQSHSVRVIPVSDGDGSVKKRGQGFKPSAQSPVSFSGSAHPKTTLIGDGRVASANKREASNALPSASRLSNCCRPGSR